MFREQGVRHTAIQDISKFSKCCIFMNYLSPVTKAESVNYV